MITIVNAMDGLGKTDGFLERLKEVFKKGQLDKYGEKGVEALRRNTPVDTGLAADSWYYTINHTKEGAELIWGNSDIEGGRNVAILVNFGHATRSGTYVQGRHFIEPALLSVFDQIAEEINKEVLSK